MSLACAARRVRTNAPAQRRRRYVCENARARTPPCLIRNARHGGCNPPPRCRRVLTDVPTRATPPTTQELLQLFRQSGLRRTLALLFPIKNHKLKFTNPKSILLRHSSFVIHHSSFVIRHSSFLPPLHSLHSIAALAPAHLLFRSVRSAPCCAYGTELRAMRNPM
jgi:hypothetical protein